MMNDEYIVEPRFPYSGSMENAGIRISLEEVWAEYAAALKKSVDELIEEEKQQAIMERIFSALKG